MKKVVLPALVFVMTFCLSHYSNAQLEAGKVLDFIGDGAWCWFQDPRSVYIKGEHERIYAQWMTNNGHLQVGSYNLKTGLKEFCTLKSNWDTDDHNVGAFLVLEDKRIMVFYARHNKQGIYCRTTVHPEDISQWSEEVVISNENKITYAHPVYLSQEGKYFVFWRGPSWKPTFSTSQDGKNWTAPKILIQGVGKEAQEVRPYTKVTSDGVSSIHIAFTDGHPNREPQNSIYYLKYEKGSFFKADGAAVGDIGSLPIGHGASDVIYNAKKGGARSWIWDIQLSEGGVPSVVYTLFPNESEHHYYYSRWTGSEWTRTKLIKGGSWFPQTREGEKERETYYSGGISMNPANPTTLYISRQIDGAFEVEQWKSKDEGRTWETTSITNESKHLNVRPVVPAGLPKGMEVVLWMAGDYRHYTNYETAIKLMILQE